MGEKSVIRKLTALTVLHGNVNYNTQRTKLSVHVVSSLANHSSTTQFLLATQYIMLIIIHLSLTEHSPSS